METSDFYFLAMVLVAFGAFALAMVIATLQYKKWLRQTEAHQPAAANRNEPDLKRAA
jgi:hypothetical protein